jgi:hypothetical protein
MIMLSAEQLPQVGVGPRLHHSPRPAYIQCAWHRPCQGELFVRTRSITLALVFAISIAAVSAFAQQGKPEGVLPSAELAKLVPSVYFYRGQSATVQMRNSSAVRTKDQKYLIAGLVDTSGYASDVAAKYQGLFITEVKVKVEGSELAPGQYGFGFVGDKFVITDVGANDVLTVSAKRDDNLKRAVPLKIVQEGGDYRLYNGKKYVTFQVE